MSACYPSAFVDPDNYDTILGAWRIRVEVEVEGKLWTVAAAKVDFIFVYLIPCSLENDARGFTNGCLIYI